LPVIDGGFILALKVFIFYIVIQQIENYVLSPVVAHRTVGIPPLVVLLSFLIGITGCRHLGSDHRNSCGSIYFGIHQ